MDLSNLLSPEALATFVQERRRSHGTDHEVYDDLLAAIRAKYRAEHIEGDRFRASARRSRKLEKQAKRLVKGAQMQYAALEALLLAHADHSALVQALPEQRRAKALAKAGRSAALGELAAKSLNKTAGALTQKPEEKTGQDKGVPASLHDLRKGA
ncbi:hypothetical protein ACH4E8_34330 [Streptomyces sp. NPDC017979]|uniref:hypothetical protein n=1 Tax=Streptomyces sp. NPDC017979 TaxID=3365024 RepID=UPI0037B87282